MNKIDISPPLEFRTVNFYLDFIGRLMPPDSRNNKELNLELVNIFKKDAKLMDIKVDDFDVFEEGIKLGKYDKYTKRQKESPYTKRQKEFLYLDSYLKSIKDKYNELILIMIPEEKGEETPDFLFITPKDHFFLEMVRAWNEHETEYENKVFDFHEKLKGCFKEEKLITCFGQAAFCRLGDLPKDKYKYYFGYLFLKELEGLRGFLRKERLLDDQHSNCIIKTISGSGIFQSILKNKHMKEINPELTDKENANCEERIKKIKDLLKNDRPYVVKDLELLIEDINKLISSLKIREKINPFFINNELLNEKTHRIQESIRKKFKKEYKKNELFKPTQNNTLVISSISLISHLPFFNVVNHIHQEILSFLNKEFGKETHPFFSHIFLSFNQDKGNFLFSKADQGEWELEYPVGSVPISQNLKNPQEFISRLDEYHFLNPDYWIDLLDNNFIDSIESKGPLTEKEWNSLLDFFMQILENLNQKEKKAVLAKAISKLIEKFIDCEFKNTQSFSKVWSILKYLISQTSSERPQSEIIFEDWKAESLNIDQNWFMNTPLGYVLLAMVKFSRELKDHPDIDKDMFGLLQEKLFDHERVVEFSFFAGAFLIKECFLGKDFCDTHFEVLFPKKGQPFIETMSGYLESFNRNFKPFLYQILKERQYFKYALQRFNEFGSCAQTSLCEHILTGYLHKYDAVFEESILKFMLKTIKIEEVFSYCETFFYRFSSEAEELYLPENEKIFNFLYERISDNGNLKFLEQNLLIFKNFVKDWSEESKKRMNNILRVYTNHHADQRCAQSLMQS